MPRILICDPLQPIGIEMLRESGAEIHQLTAEERPRLAEIIGDYDAVIVRSATQMTGDLLRAGKRLKVVGRAGIGVDNVDVATATELGVLVVNAPTANLMSATEHTFALLLALARKIPAADASMKSGDWDRKSYVGQELQDKTLGLIGFGRIGQRVAERAQAFGMEVMAFDPYLDAAVAERIGVEMVKLEDLLQRADVVSLHTPMTEQTRNILSAERLALMKPSALLVNCARGGLVDEDALLTALDEGRLGGAALDVYAEEPPKDFRLMKHRQVVATPHIGAQTEEAQERIATQTARMLLAALDGSLAVSAVNLPFRPASKAGEPFLQLGERMGRLASKLLGGSLQKLEVELWGIDEALRPAVTVAALRGALYPFLGEGVNYVNAERIARDRGVSVVRSTHSEGREYAHLVRVNLVGSGGSMELAGTLYGNHHEDGDPRVVSIAGFRLEFRPVGKLLFLRNRDIPGVVGKLGTTLGVEGVNIAGIHLARHDAEPYALAVLLLDHEPSPAVLDKVRALDEVQEVTFVDMD